MTSFDLGDVTYTIEPGRVVSMWPDGLQTVGDFQYLKRDPAKGVEGRGNPYTARHTFATRWRARGLELDDLAQILGHSFRRDHKRFVCAYGDAGDWRPDARTARGVTAVNELDHEITFDQVGCARCWGDGHPGITFTKLTHPMELDDGSRGTHWALCPTNGEPIFLFFMGKDDASEVAS